jgi:hypothetical protein
MPATPVASWRRHATAAASSTTPRTLLFLLPVLLFVLFVLSRAPDLTFSASPTAAASASASASASFPHLLLLPGHVRPFDCYASPQASPVFASLVEGVPHPFFYSLADMGALPEHPHKNIMRLQKGKRFRKPDISETIQELLVGEVGKSSDGVVVDIGANVGMASFAAAVMGFRVVAFEPVFENLQRICDGVYLNRVQDRIVVYHAAASDRLGNITMHKVLVLSLIFHDYSCFLVESGKIVVLIGKYFPPS